MSQPNRAPITMNVTRAIFAAAVVWLAAEPTPGRLGCCLAQSGTANTASDGSVAARRWFETARFGLSITWGVNSLVGKGESVMNDDKVPIREYAKLPARFNPNKFDADALVKLAQDAGAKYIVVSAKQPDGFCMFASKLTEYDIVDATPYHQDPIKAMADACHQRKMKLFFSYSLLDWHHPDYFPLGKTGQAAGRGPAGNWRRYVTYYQGQVRELLTKYGQVGGIWFHGHEDRPDADWDLTGTYRLIHQLQPAALIGNSHRRLSLAGEDIQQSEPTSIIAPPFDSKAVTLPREIAMTINDSQGYNPRDPNFKSVDTIIQSLVAAAGTGANFRLIVAPGPDGTLGPEISQSLLDVGKWLTRYGDTIYGTHGGPFPAQPWGVFTFRGATDHPDEIFMHILKPKLEAPILFDASTAWIPFVHGKTTPLKWTRSRNGVALDVPRDEFVPTDTIIVLKKK